jgi:hypothetical protein
MLKILRRRFGFDQRVAAMGAKRGGNVLFVHTGFLGDAELIGSVTTVFTFFFRT